MALLTLDGSWIRVNPALCQIVGYSEQELLATNFQSITHSEDLGTDLNYVSQMLSREIRSYQMEKRYFHKAGHIVWVFLSVSLVFDRKGKPLFFFGQIQDITGRKRTEETLHEYDERMRFSLEAANVGCWEWDILTGRVWWSSNMEQVHGQASGSFGSTFEGFLNGVSPDDRERVLKTIKESINGNGKFSVEYRQLRPDRDAGWMEGIGQVIYDDSRRPLRMMGICMNVTESKRAEEKLRQGENQLRQVQKMEAVGRLAGGVAHDFNNLLSVIIGYSELSLAQLAPEAELYKAVAQIKKAGERAASLTRQLLAFSRQQVLEPQILNLNTVVADVTKMLRRMIGEDINLGNVLLPALGHVKADRSQIEQVLMNLAVNARDAMPQGGQLTIETTNVELDETSARLYAPAQPGQYVMLAVTDTGCGMDDETQAHIFEPFFTTKELGKGTGLGLATVYGIVKQSGGYIWVSSEPGRGSTFKIYLPTVDEPIGTGWRSELPVKAAQGTETVLVVEDDEPLRMFICECLERQGYRVLATGSPAEAVETAEHHKGEIHLMLSDVVMPGMSGRELAEQLAPRWPEMKVLYASGYNDDVIVHYGVLESGLAFLQKPFTPVALAQKVREILNSAPPQSTGKPPEDWVIWGKKPAR